MEIRKVYDIETLKNKLQESIEEARKNSTTRVKVDILTAQEVLEVLEETYKREQKHQMLESELTFVEKEDGTQTNEMEMHSKQEMPDCIGMYSEKENPEYCARCTNELLCKIIEEQKM